MSRAMVLEGLRDFLRKENGWTFTRCDIQHKSTPPALARGLFIALDDAGVTAGPQENYYLQEQFGITVGVWIETAIQPADMSGNTELKTAKYIEGGVTLDDLERRMIRQLHQKYDTMAFVNCKFGLPGENGDKFIAPMFYGGSGKTEAVNPNPQNDRAAQWFGRRLRFSGFNRNQTIDCMR